MENTQSVKNLTLADMFTQEKPKNLSNSAGKPKTKPTPKPIPKENDQIVQIKEQYAKNHGELILLEQNLIISSNESAKNIYRECSEFESKSTEQLNKDNVEMSHKITAFNYMKKNKMEGDKNKAILREQLENNSKTFNVLFEYVEESKKNYEEIKKNFEDMRKKFVDQSSIINQMVDTDITVKLRKNYEFFLYYFFNINKKDQIESKASALKIFFNILEKNFTINKKRTNVNKILINIDKINDIIFSTEYINPKKSLVKKNPPDETKLINLIFHLVENFEEPEFLRCIKNSKDDYYVLSSDLHYSELIPKCKFKPIRQEMLDDFKLAFKITDFCEEQGKPQRVK